MRPHPYAGILPIQPSPSDLPSDAGPLLPDEVPIIARRGELVVPPERVVREEKSAREQRPVTLVVNVTAADASSFRASQGQIAADMARAIDRASRNR